MQQPLDPSQDAYYRSDQSQLSSAFSVNRKNPYDQPEQAENPPSRYMSVYQSSSGASGRSSLFTQAGAALSVDQQLSSGWYACYRYWLYWIIITQGIIFLFAALGFVGIGSYRYSYANLTFFDFVDVTQSSLEVSYAITMIKVLKYKKFEKTMLGFKLAIVDFILVIVEIGLGVYELKSSWRSEGNSSFFGGNLLSLFDLIIDPFFAITVLIPAWKIKRLIEKREAILQSKEDLFSLPM